MGVTIPIFFTVNKGGQAVLESHATRENFGSIAGARRDRKESRVRNRHNHEFIRIHGRSLLFLSETSTNKSSRIRLRSRIYRDRFRVEPYGSGSMSDSIICPVEHLGVSWFVSNHRDLFNVIMCEAANLPTHGETRTSLSKRGSPWGRSRRSPTFPLLFLLFMTASLKSLKGVTIAQRHRLVLKIDQSRPDCVMNQPRNIVQIQALH